MCTSFTMAFVLYSEMREAHTIQKCQRHHPRRRLPPKGSPDGILSLIPRTGGEKDRTTVSIADMKCPHTHLLVGTVMLPRSPRTFFVGSMISVVVGRSVRTRVGVSGSNSD